MPAYRVEISSPALRALAALPADAKARITREIEALAAQPRPPGVKPLRGRERLWRLRVGVYRVVYQVNDAARLVRVVVVGHRRDVYRGIG